MSDFTNTAIEGMVNAVDGVTTNVLETLQSLVHLAGTTAEAPIHIAEDAAKSALDEIETAKKGLLDAIRKGGHVIGDPLP